MIVYKIRSKANNEMFLHGTPVYNSWNKSGRIFQTLGKLRTFLTSAIARTDHNRDISNWEIVELEMVEKSVKGVHEVVTPKTLVKILTR